MPEEIIIKIQKTFQAPPSPSPYGGGFAATMYRVPRVPSAHKVSKLF